MSQALSASVNDNAARLVDDMAAAAATLRIAVAEGANGERLIDAGAKVAGGIEAGLRLAAIAMGGLGEVRLVAGSAASRWPWSIEARSSQPVIACLASQYAGWKLTCGEGKGAWFGMGSGPGRALARKEPLFDELAYRDESQWATIVLEAETPPPGPVLDKLARDCRVEPRRLNVLYAPTRSLAGMVQIAARALEVALHRAHELGFPLDRIVDGLGAAPLPPPHPDLVTAIGRSNDAIIYGGRAHLMVTGPADDARRLAAEAPSRASRDYGEPFAATFRRFNGDFYAIDPRLFSPAEVIVTAIDSGRSFRGGAIDRDIVDASFG